MLALYSLMKEQFTKALQEQKALRTETLEHAAKMVNEVKLRAQAKEEKLMSEVLALQTKVKEIEA